MTLSRRDQPYLIPSYSLTGDLLAYRRCGLQYRYYNRGALPPSRPVQQWFGEFIHGVMEEAYRTWREHGWPFPWSDTQISDLEDLIVRRLAARGLRYRNRRLLEISQERGRLAINLFGPHLFPLISQAEWPLHAVRPMPGDPAQARAEYYEVSGVADVLTSVNLRTVSSDNLIIAALERDPTVADALARGRSDPGYEFEVLVDYKGMERPPITSQFAEDLRWQLLTYAWLRSQQPDSTPVVAGVLIFINELLLTADEVGELKKQVVASSPDTDVLPQGADLDAITQWRRRDGRLELSKDYRLARALRVIPVTPGAITDGLGEFDTTVGHIETAVGEEASGVALHQSWRGTPNEQTCAVCDWRSICPDVLPRFRGAPAAP
jgi:hypothetical protein